MTSQVRLTAAVAAVLALGAPSAHASAAVSCPGVVKRGGVSFVTPPHSDELPRAAVLSRPDGDHIFAAASDDVVRRSSDGGCTWSEVYHLWNDSIEGHRATLNSVPCRNAEESLYECLRTNSGIDLLVAGGPQAMGVLYVVGRRSGMPTLARSDDGGSTFVEVTVPSAGPDQDTARAGTPLAITIAPSDGKTLYATRMVVQSTVPSSAARALFHSSDGGQSWTRRTWSTAYDFGLPVVSPVNPREFYVRFARPAGNKVALGEPATPSDPAPDTVAGDDEYATAHSTDAGATLRRATDRCADPVSVTAPATPGGPAVLWCTLHSRQAGGSGALPTRGYTRIAAWGRSADGGATFGIVALFDVESAANVQGNPVLRMHQPNARTVDQFYAPQRFGNKYGARITAWIPLPVGARSFKSVDLMSSNGTRVWVRISAGDRDAKYLFRLASSKMY